MTTRQWKIYNLIKDNNIISSEELCKKLEIETDKDSEKRNLSRKSLDLYKEIEEINDSPLIEKPILWDTKNNYWIARSQDDIKHFVNRIYKKIALKKLSKMWRLLKKGRRNGQGKLFTNDLREIEGSSAREFVESFASDLEIQDEIEMLEQENNEIEFDELKYVNGRYQKKQQNEERIKELKKWLKERLS